MEKFERDVLIQSMAEECNAYSKECERKCVEEHGKISGAHYMMNRLFEYFHPDDEESYESNKSVEMVRLIHAEWILFNSDHVERTYKCSNCGHEAWGDDEKTPYCPGCGAKMNEDKKDGEN